MQKSELNDWLQVVASIGVLIGLLLVFVEIRQTNEIARAEARVSALTAWEELKRLEIESDISEIYLKSIESGRVVYLWPINSRCVCEALKFLVNC